MLNSPLGIYIRSQHQFEILIVYQTSQTIEEKEKFRKHINNKSIIKGDDKGWVNHTPVSVAATTDLMKTTPEEVTEAKEKVYTYAEEVSESMEEVGAAPKTATTIEIKVIYNN